MWTFWLVCFQRVWKERKQLNIQSSLSPSFIPQAKPLSPYPSEPLHFSPHPSWNLFQCSSYKFLNFPWTFLKAPTVTKPNHPFAPYLPPNSWAMREKNPSSEHTAVTVHLSPATLTEPSAVPTPLTGFYLAVAFTPLPCSPTFHHPFQLTVYLQLHCHIKNSHQTPKPATTDSKSTYLPSCIYLHPFSALPLPFHLHSDIF